jgi:two-component system, cell cycle sensor histidine kinase and response regulator CckA
MVRPGHRTVVVADDDAALRLLCRINLELEGYRVLEANGAEELAEVLASDDDVAVLLLDIHFGAADGVAIARDLRARRPDLPIAFFSGTLPKVDMASREVADGFISKPFTLEDLIETVRRLARA